MSHELYVVKKTLIIVPNDSCLAHVKEGLCQGLLRSKQEVEGDSGSWTIVRATVSNPRPDGMRSILNKNHSLGVTHKDALGTNLENAEDSIPHLK